MEIQKGGHLPNVSRPAGMRSDRKPGFEPSFLVLKLIPVSLTEMDTDR